MTDAAKRQHVSDLYAGHLWKKRVEKMSDEQVTAIYLKYRIDGEMPTEALEISIFTQLDLPPRDPHENEDEFPSY